MPSPTPYFFFAFVFWLLTRHYRGESHTQEYIHHFKPSTSATLVLLHSPQICSHHGTFKHHEYYTVNTITQWSQKCMPNLAHHVFHSYTRRNTHKDTEDLLFILKITVVSCERIFSWRKMLCLQMKCRVRSKSYWGHGWVAKCLPGVLEDLGSIPQKDLWKD